LIQDSDALAGPGGHLHKLVLDPTNRQALQQLASAVPAGKPDRDRLPSQFVQNFGDIDGLARDAIGGGLRAIYCVQIQVREPHDPLCRRGCPDAKNHPATNLPETDDL
jgi:hypothetical protein